MLENFMFRDMAATIVAAALFGVLTVVPGYVIGWLTDLFQFRTRAFLCRAAVAVSLSTALTPILTHVLWRWSLAAVWAAYGTCGLAFTVLVARKRLLTFGPVKSSRSVKAL